MFRQLSLSRRKIRLIEGNAKCRHLKKLTCKGTLRQLIIICLRPRTPNPPPPPIHTKYVYAVYLFTQRRGRVVEPWMKEEKGIRHRGEGAYLRCPVSTTVQFSLRNEGSSEYICVCEGRESLRPNF